MDMDMDMDMGMYMWQPPPVCQSRLQTEMGGRVWWLRAERRRHFAPSTLLEYSDCMYRYRPPRNAQRTCQRFSFRPLISLCTVLDEFIARARGLCKHTICAPSSHARSHVCIFGRLLPPNKHFGPFRAPSHIWQAPAPLSSAGLPAVPVVKWRSALDSADASTQRRCTAPY